MIDWLFVWLRTSSDVSNRPTLRNDFAFLKLKIPENFSFDNLVVQHDRKTFMKKVPETTSDFVADYCFFSFGSFFLSFSSFLSNVSVL